MSDEEKLGYQGAVPPEGAYFDRVDVDTERHSRTYHLNGQRIMDLVALPDPDRPGKWSTAVRWLRRGKWLPHGWGPLDSEKDALSMIDAVAIGVEAATGGCMFLGNLPPEVTKAPGPRPKAMELVLANGWPMGTILHSEKKWNGDKELQQIDSVEGVKLRDVNSRTSYWVKRLPPDVVAVGAS